MRTRTKKKAVASLTAFARAIRVVVVVARCVACGHRREIGAGEIAPDELPICDKCGSPMVAESAKETTT